MVDALRKVKQWIAPSGRLIDLHPSADVARVLVGEEFAGLVNPGGATARHQGATDALASVAREGLFTIEDAVDFEFSTYADSLDELNQHVLENWRETRIPASTMARARSLVTLHSAPVSLRERVLASRLRA
jgi:hypothetical protein